MSRHIYLTSNGKRYSTDDIDVIIEHHERTGDYPNDFTQKDWEDFTRKYIGPYSKIES